MIIFDCLCHPTIDQTWNNKFCENSFEKLINEMDQANIAMACVVGIAGIGSFDIEKYFILANKYKKRLFPIAGLNPNQYSDGQLKDQINTIKKIGYYGIKIHPRYSKIDLNSDKNKLIKTFNYAADINIPIFLCSYYASNAPYYPSTDPLIQLSNIVKETPDTKLILLHGGGVRILEYMEFCRFNKNILMDLSLTIMKYSGSSIDLDLKFLFKNFDQRICIGSDHPEWKLSDFYKKIELLTEGLSSEKINNISYKNLSDFLNINLV